MNFKLTVNLIELLIFDDQTGFLYYYILLGITLIIAIKLFVLDHLISSLVLSNNYWQTKETSEVMLFETVLNLSKIIFIISGW